METEHPNEDSISEQSGDDVARRFFSELDSITFNNIEWKKRKIQSERGYFKYDAQWGAYNLTIEFTKVRDFLYTAETTLVRIHEKSPRHNEEKTELYQSMRQFFEAIAGRGISVKHIFSTTIDSMIEWAQDLRYGNSVFFDYSASMKEDTYELFKIYQ